MISNKKSALVTLWLVAKEIVNMAIRSIGILILVRYLSPCDFGVYAVALGLQQFFTSSLQMGINVYIVKYNGNNLKKVCDSIFTLSLIITLVFTLISLISTMTFSKYILFWLFIASPFSILSMVPQGLLEKKLNFSAVAKSGVIAQLLFYIVALPLAILGYGVWAPVFGFIVMTIASTFLIFYFSGYKPSLIICSTENKEFISFGISYAISIIGYALKNLIQPLIIAPMGGVEMSGIIAIANRLTESLNIFIESIKKYSVSKLSLAQDNADTFSKYISKGVVFQVIVTGSILAMFNALAPSILPIFVGSKWTPMYMLFPYISIFLMIASLSTVQIASMQIKNKNYIVTLYYVILNTLIGIFSFLLIPSLNTMGYGIALLLSFPAQAYLLISVNKLIGNISYNQGILWFTTTSISIFLTAALHPICSLLFFIPLALSKERSFLKNFIYDLIPGYWKNTNGEKVKLYWFKPQDGKNNFGDELGPYVIKELSGLEVMRVPTLKLTNFFLKDVIVAIGSIIEHNHIRKTIIWGSGLICYNSKFKKESKYLAVRGKLTQLQLKKAGIEVSYIGDPAILLPLIYRKTWVKKYKIGIIPHYTHYAYFKELSNNDTFLIDLTKDIESVIDDINSCTVTVSSSLHGLIVSHSYGIPSVWVNPNNVPPLVGGDYKFMDYFSSVGIQCKNPYDISDLIDTPDVIEKIKSLCDVNCIAINIEILQKGLITCAPFKIKSQYKKE